MRRTFVVALLTGVLMVFAAGPAFAAHCQNLSKKPGAGAGVTVLVSTSDELISIEGHGGYANIYVDFNDNEVADTGELVAEVQLGKNHSPNLDVEDSESLWVNPGAIHKFLQGRNLDHGMGFPPEA